MIKELISKYQLLPHPEGGYYKETYRSAENIAHTALAQHFSGPRSFSTAIYFLLLKDLFSAFHRIKSDECWHFYEGASLHVHVLHLNGNYELIRLGRNSAKGEVYQAIVPAGAWFVCIHARENVYSPDDAIHNNSRNCDIKNYEGAADEIIARGGW